MSDKDKKAFVLRINATLLKEIENWAGDEFRSTNGQIEYLLNEALKSRRKRRINKNDTD
ncbi:Arc family DNA binding domain-containing protein [Pedobacter steynii]|uniref:Arc family DNA binding domain-containing protein n=1 Tax=Pedobacter steynii TaxID=430522 RepID=A0A1D7QJP3_9SPHI|nr:Arc family DNA binding domain-containing protein [Pedobacter steynii]AOM78860.1 Arc family DNA binding domain-containing protein [Pedobacter steynii]